MNEILMSDMMLRWPLTHSFISLALSLHFTRLIYLHCARISLLANRQNVSAHSAIIALEQIVSRGVRSRIYRLFIWRC